jgi:hypothetical protein
MKLISKGYTVNRLNPTSPKGVGGFYSPPGSVKCVRVVSESHGRVWVREVKVRRVVVRDLM